jgi:hypothetical protein
VVFVSPPVSLSDAPSVRLTNRHRLTGRSVKAPEVCTLAVCSKRIEIDCESSVFDLDSGHNDSVPRGLDLMADGPQALGPARVEASGVVAVHGIAGCPIGPSRKNVRALGAGGVLILQLNTN